MSMRIMKIYSICLISISTLLYSCDSESSEQKATAAVQVTVVDSSAPLLNCPATVFAAADHNCQAIVEIDVDSTDNCGRKDFFDP